KPSLIRGRSGPVRSHPLLGRSLVKSPARPETPGVASLALDMTVRMSRRDGCWSIAAARREGTRTEPRECTMPTLLWMECGACSGESMAILGAEGPGLEGDNLPGFLESYDVQLLWHPSHSMESPREAEGLIGRILAGRQELTLLCVEGSIIHGPDGTGMF